MKYQEGSESLCKYKLVYFTGEQFLSFPLLADIKFFFPHVTKIKSTPILTLVTLYFSKSISIFKEITLFSPLQFSKPSAAHPKAQSNIKH